LVKYNLMKKHASSRNRTDSGIEDPRPNDLDEKKRQN